MVEDGLVVGRAAGRDEDGGEDRQRQRRPAHPVRLSHCDYCADDRIFRFHNSVFLSVCCVLLRTAQPEAAVPCLSERRFTSLLTFGFCELVE